MLIVRAARDYLHVVWGALFFLSTTTATGGADANRWRWRVVHVSGTIKSCQRVAMKYAYRQIKAMIDGVHNEKDKQKLLDIMAAAKKAILATEA